MDYKTIKSQIEYWEAQEKDIQSGIKVAQAQLKTVQATLKTLRSLLPKKPAPEFASTFVDAPITASPEENL